MASIRNTIPPGAALGAAMINVVNEGQVVAEGSVRIEAVAPGIFTANADGRGGPAAVALVRNLWEQDWVSVRFI